MSKLNKEQKLGEIVAEFPGAARIFNEKGIDYCCHGDVTLEKALVDKDIEVASFVDRINKEYDEFLNSKEEYIDWRKEDPNKLIDNIVNVHHAFTFRELLEIDQLLLKILKVHYHHSGEELKTVHRLFGALKVELEEHLIKEEEELFPMIREYTKNPSKELRDSIMKFIGVTENEHTGAGHILQDLYRETNGYKTPEWACTTFKLVYKKLDALEKDLFVHIHKENSILFKEF
ncbi:iron-sulfur cluster repair di-iron protein [Clostridium sp.]|uniref:iron-sulfur cluster repair di-iron protein n=1 Tax=Clostridium sp. TaxID=1506 RepID=UPI002A91332B|nr:iron-sulfur cluster repair di-iron protein [Clostridium sp.]MDY6011359.1 iron-sulfur cluster repair di-iron protein [Clostridium sp.]